MEPVVHSTTKNKICSLNMELALVIPLNSILTCTSERERQIPCDFTFMWKLKYDTNAFIYETEIESENRQVVAKGVGGGRGLDWESEISRCKLVYTDMSSCLPP